MSRVLEKHPVDMSPIYRIEALYGRKLPDLLEPVRRADADVDAIKQSADEYKSIANQLESIHAELSSLSESYEWIGDAGKAAKESLGVILIILKWIAAIILCIIAALLMLVALVLYAIGAILNFIGVVISWVAAIIAVVVVLVVLVRSGGRGNTGRLQIIWATLVAVFNGVRMTAMGIVGALAQGIGWLFEMAAKGVMWLALYLVEVAGKLTGDPSPEV